MQRTSSTRTGSSPLRVANRGRFGGGGVGYKSLTANNGGREYSMDPQESGQGGRWDVGFKDDEVYLARRSEDDEQLLSDRLEPQEARELAALLNKYAEKAESADKGGLA